jgi:pilus assembly protein CpaE
MPEKNIAVKIQTKNEKIREELKEVILSVEGFHLHNDSPLPCDLLILEIGDDPKKDFQNMNTLQTSGGVKEVFLTSSRTEPGLLLQALRAGAKEFFPQPINREEVRDAFLKLKALREGAVAGRPKGKIIDVIGSKGGVGTTTVAVNLAASLQGLSSFPSVALIDMNLLFGEVPIFLNVEPIFNWGEMARNISRVDSTYLKSSLSRHPSGISVLCSPPSLDGVHTAAPLVIEKLLNLMQSIFDFVVIDSGQNLDNISHKILEKCDLLFLVSVLSLPGLINIKKLQNTFRNLGYPREENIKIIINRYHKKSPISLKEAEQSIDKNIFWLIPNDYPTTMSAINQGKALSAVAHEAEISQNFRDLAGSFSDNGGRKEKRRVWNRRFFREKMHFWGELVMNRKVPGER